MCAFGAAWTPVVLKMTSILLSCNSLLIFNFFSSQFTFVTMECLYGAESNFKHWLLPVPQVTVAVMMLL